MKKPIFHIITGNGKGKTTSALGLALRAIGTGKKVKIIQFMKKPDFSEHKAISKFKLPIEIEAYGIGFYKILGDTHSEKEHQNAAKTAWKAAQEAILSNRYDLVVLDELNIAIRYKLLDINKVLSFLNTLKAVDCRPKAVSQPDQYFDLVITGRNAHPKLKKIADLVSEVKCIKHYFDNGLEARKGIEL